VLKIGIHARKRRWHVMLLGSCISDLTVPSDVMMRTTPSMSPVSMLLWREHITSSTVGTSGAYAFPT